MVVGASDNFVADLTRHIFQYSVTCSSSPFFCRSEPQPVESPVAGCEMGGNPREYSAIRRSVVALEQ